jgi:sugar-specific transcriptional regulator TrmB
MTEETHSNRQIQVLRDLGLSRAESEVYLACLNLGANGAGTLSSYRVAQDMGRDPANIGKIVNALVRLQAVRVVQEKPRLFVAVPPEEFTARLLGQMKQRGADAVTLLESLGAPATDGIAQALTGRAQAFARFRGLIASCRRDLLVAGSPDTVRELGVDLERVAEQPGRRVRVVSPQAFSSTVVEIAVLPTAGRLGQDPSEDWLVLAIDDVSWLVALVPQQNAPTAGPCGWWCAGSPLARVLADYLESCWRTGVQVSRVGEPAVTTIEEPEATPGGTGFMPFAASSPAVATPAPVTTPAPRPASVAEPAPAAAAAPPASATAFEDATPATRPADPAATPPSGPDSAPPAAPAAEKPAPAAEKPAPWTRTFTSDEAEQAGFTFLFKHERKPGRDGR